MLDGVVVDDEAAFGVHLGDFGPCEGVGVTEFDGLAVDGGVHGQLRVDAFDGRLGVGAADGFKGVLLAVGGRVAHGAAHEVAGGHRGDVPGQIVGEPVVGQAREPPPGGYAVSARVDVADFVEAHPRLRVPPKQRAQQLRPRHPVRGEQFAINYNHEASSHVRPCRAARAVRNICLVSARFRAGPIPTLRSLWHGPPLRRTQTAQALRASEGRKKRVMLRPAAYPAGPPAPGRPRRASRPARHPSEATYILGYIPPLPYRPPGQPHPSAATYILGYIPPLPYRPLQPIS